jgi:hypothetical protein
MRMNDVFPSNYLKADTEVPEEGEVAVTISSVTMETLGQGKDSEEKPVIFFEEFDKGLVCNKTNWQMISRVCGSDDSDDWVGRRIALYSTDVQFGNEVTRGIRVRSKAPKASAGKPAPAVATETASASQPAQDRQGNGGGRPQRARNQPVTQAEADQNPDPDDDIPFVRPAYPYPQM